MRLQDKIAIVTGAARGIGLGIARRFAAEGASVIMADREQAPELAGAEFVHCDLADPAAARALVSGVLARHGRVDVLVNNAGIIRAADVLALDLADFDAVLAVNLRAPFVLAQAAARAMVEQGAGAIVNISSVNAVLTIPNQLPYNVAKGGLNQLTRVMAVALAGRGVRVNAIGPGSILTEMLKTAVMRDPAARRMVLSRTPMGRCGEVDEIAAVAVFLACDESSYITGQVIYADGGRLPLNYVVPVPGGEG